MATDTVFADAPTTARPEGGQQPSPLADRPIHAEWEAAGFNPGPAETLATVQFALNGLQTIVRILDNSDVETYQGERGQPLPPVDGEGLRQAALALASMAHRQLIGLKDVKHLVRLAG